MGEGYKRPTNFIKEKYTSPTIDKPIKWNAEKPYLYTVEFKYKDEMIQQKIGFVYQINIVIFRFQLFIKNKSLRHGA